MRLLANVKERTVNPKILNKNKVVRASGSKNNFNVNPDSAIIPKDIIQPLSNDTVKGYNLVEKKSSKSGIFSLSSAEIGTLALILKVTSTVKRVKTNPANVSTEVDKSVVNESSVAYSGTSNSYLKYINLTVPTTITPNV